MRGGEISPLTIMARPKKIDSAENGLVQEIESEVQIEIKDSDVVTIIADSAENGLVKGKEYVVSGNVAKILITKKVAKLK